MFLFFKKMSYHHCFSPKKSKNRTNLQLITDGIQFHYCPKTNSMLLCQDNSKRKPIVENIVEDLFMDSPLK